jgi:putative Holliday junction resolvase
MQSSPRGYNNDMSRPAAPLSHSGTDANCGHVLAIDYGRSRLGLALSDPLGFTARPLATWRRSNRRHDLSRLRSLCREHNVTTILVGLPLRLDGTRGEMAEEAARFGERLRTELRIPIELVDERLSSWDAEQTLAESTPRKSRSRNNGSRRPLDEVAAAVILRDYLHRTSGAA